MHVPNSETRVSANLVEADCKVIWVSLAESQGIAGPRVAHGKGNDRPARQDAIPSCLGGFKTNEINTAGSEADGKQVIKRGIW